MRTKLSVLAALLVVAVALAASSAPAFAHDWRSEGRNRKNAPIGPLQQALAGGVVAQATFGSVSAGHPRAVPFRGTLTNLPTDPSAGFPSPTAACGPPSCAELRVDVPDGAKTLYGTIGWDQPSYYLELFAIAPDGHIFGQTADEANHSYNKEVGNDRTIPRAQFTIASPKAGKWIIRALSVFSNNTKFDGVVAASADPPLQFKRLGVRQLADQFGTQRLRMNVVSVGRTLTPSQIAGLRDQLPDQYRPSVLQKAFPDCSSDDNVVECQGGTLLNWVQPHFSGTKDPVPGDKADGNVPYFEAIHFRYDYRFYSASERWTRDLFSYMRSITKRDQPFALYELGTRPYRGQGQFLSQYNLERGALFRGADAQVPNPAITGDKIDPWLVEDWIFKHRFDRKYASAFRDLESGKTRDGRFINPDPGAVYDPFYTSSGKKDLTRMPQGPATSLTFFVMDTFTSKLARQYFRPNAYHAFDLSSRFIDPDSKAPAGPDYARMWGGRYRFFFLDIGAMPNKYEALDGFTEESPTDSATPPLGDPPVWEMFNNPVWSGEATFIEKVARDVRMMTFLRLTASYLYRPIPADVYFIANNNWSDYYSRPAPEGGGGIAYTDLTKVYDVKYVEGNLASAIPGATFETERSDKRLKTFRYLGCSTVRAGSSSTAVPGAPTVMIPVPTCAKDDPFQHALEDAKARGDDVAGTGAPLAVSASVLRKFVEEHRNEIAPLRPNQLTVTNISVVFPLFYNWDIPLLVGGVAFATPNQEAWGVLQNINDRNKAARATDCTKSPIAPECLGQALPPNRNPGRGFSYTIEHESSHFLGLLHPHDTNPVQKNSAGQWEYYSQIYVSMGDFSQAPTTYAGSFAPYSVLDQDIIQRGHTAEYMRMSQDNIADAYLRDGVAGRTSPSDATVKRRAEMERWRTLGSRLFACGDYLHSEHAMRNAFLASQGVFGPIVAPRQLRAGERVLFEVKPQAVYGPAGGGLPGCAQAEAFHDTGPSAEAGVGGISGSGFPGAVPLAAIGVAGVATGAARRRRARAR